MEAVVVCITGGSGWVGVAAGATSDQTVGTVAGFLLSAAQPIIANNQTYYYDVRK